MFMIYNSNKMFFFFILFFSTMISISSNSWLGCWIGLEINLLSFIPLISNPNNLMNTETSLKYFLIQSIASINFLFLILFKMILIMKMNTFFLSMLINSSLLLKMGSTPFHFWFPNIMEGLSWLNCFILMTWQKISPMILLSYYLNKNFLIYIMILNVFIGAIGSLNQTSLRKIMAFSSINNLGWMLSSMLISDNLWLMYFFFYSFLSMLMCFLFFLLNIYFINQMFNFNMKFSMKICILINFFSMAGLPPFIGFFPKWITINFLIMNNYLFIPLIFIFMSLIMLFIYMRIMYSSLLLFKFKFKWFNFFLKNKLLSMINFFNFLSLLGIIFSTFLYF